MKLWHDDVRRPPSVEWSWAQTNEEAKLFLFYANAIEEAGGDGITECSLDHDLGAKPEDGPYAKGTAEENGMRLVEWMIEHDLVPAKVTIHSWNGVAARRMAQALNAAGHNVTLAPYDIKHYQEWYDPAKDR
jgi:hypothetical protein